MTERVRVKAPVRILDAGGWTDTWFAGHGMVCSLAVSEGSEVSVDLLSLRRGGEPVVELLVQSFGEHYSFSLHEPPGRHPLIEAAVARWCPPRFSIKVQVASSVPPGSGLGTSACVLVALVAALGAAAGRVIEPKELASEAHRIESGQLGLQSGLQDQIAAAYGGANLITVGPYPTVEVRSLQLAADTWEELGRRLVTVYLGTPHRSSAIHEAVITRLNRLGASEREELLRPLRSAAHRAALALMAGNIDEYGQAMIYNTEAQSSLHPGLVGSRARAVIERVRVCGAAGWKVNGAGGDGGSLTIVCPHDPEPVVAELKSMDGITRLRLEPALEGATLLESQ